MSGDSYRGHSGGSTRHGGTQEVPAEALLSDDFELWLIWAPLTEGGSCRYEACESDEACTCQIPLEDYDEV